MRAFIEHREFSTQERPTRRQHKRSAFTRVEVIVIMISALIEASPFATARWKDRSDMYLETIFRKRGIGILAIAGVRDPSADREGSNRFRPGPINDDRHRARVLRLDKMKRVLAITEKRTNPIMSRRAFSLPCALV